MKITKTDQTNYRPGFPAGTPFSDAAPRFTPGTRRLSHISGKALRMGGGVAAMVALTVSAAGDRNVAEVAVEDGDVTIRYTGILGHDYTIETSETLAEPWTPLLTDTADSFGRVTFTDSVAGASQFYRIQSDPLNIPLVYQVENTGADCEAPPLPSFDELPTTIPLTDPFEWSDGRGRIASFDDWACRRAEIKAELEHYEIGPKPPRPEDITASYANGLLTVNITVNGETLTLTSQIVLPSGDGPFPAVIGVGSGTGSLPPDIFRSRGVAEIPFNFGQVMAHTQTRGNEPINRLYPDLEYMGAYSAWSWGVSRLIDGLELVQDELPINLERLAITGCSFAGKMALWAGAFDERIALTIPQEPGGGGAAAWRVSEIVGGVEVLGSTSHAWFMESMFQYAGNNVSKLPMDHHELMAMVAPRALLFIENPDIGWLGAESGYVSARAAHEVWKSFGVPDRFGFSIVGGHGHCALPNSQRPEVEAFVDKFLLGIETADTNVAIHPYDDVDYASWTAWWGTGEPVFPRDGTVTITLEPECGTIGEKWDVLEDPEASNGTYVMVKPGFNSIFPIANESENLITITFTVETAGEYNTFWRVNCPTTDDDGFWVKFNNDSFWSLSGLVSDGWEWKKRRKYQLEAGEHTLTIGYLDDGAMLDKICFSTYPFAPDDLGPEADNICDPE